MLPCKSSYAILINLSVSVMLISVAVTSILMLNPLSLCAYAFDSDNFYNIFRGKGYGT